MDQWAGVVLAAGEGKRMNSRVSKVLHQVCGKELVRYPVELLRELGVQQVVVVVSPSNAAGVQALFGDTVEYVTQEEALGTGDALNRAKHLLDGQIPHLLVMGSDAPLVRLHSVKPLMESHLDSSNDMTFLTAHAATAQDLGRVVRDPEGRVTSIVEAAESRDDSGEPAEINVGVYCFSTKWLWENIGGVGPGSPGGDQERYITALAAIGAGADARIETGATADPDDLQGVNNRLQLSQVEEVQRRRIREHWMLAGVTMPDPASVYIDADVKIGQDTVILPNTMILGRSEIGEDCQIGPSSIIRDSKIGNHCRATASMLEEAVMEDSVDIGPFSHLRPGAYLESGVHIGNFVEVKESRFAAGAVMGHFGYVGDASIGAQANLGAGMVTCNYDGRDKHRTNIGAGAFIGCDTMLVAPVTVGAEATTGAGAVVTKDVPPGRLAVGVPAKITDRRTKTN